MLLCTLALLPAVAMGEVKSEVIPASELLKVASAGPASKPVKLSLKDATAQDAIAAFVKETGVQLQFDNPERQNNGPLISYDVAIDAPTTEDGLHQLGLALQMGINRQSETQFRISPSYQPGFSDRRNMQGGSESRRGVRITGIRTRRDLGVPSPFQGVGRDFALSLSVNAPNTIPNGQSEVNLTEAIDEQGRTLKKSTSQNVFYGGSDFQVMRSSFGLALQLEQLDPMPKMIKSLKGDVVIKNVKSFTRTTVTELDKPQEVTIEGIKMTIGPISKTGENWRLSVKIPREAKPNEERGDVYRRVGFMWNELARATGEGGEQLRVNSGGSRSTGQGAELWLQFHLESNNRATTRQAVPKPVSASWVTANEVETIALPFEATDLVVP